MPPRKRPREQEPAAEAESGQGKLSSRTSLVSSDIAASSPGGYDSPGLDVAAEHVSSATRVRDQAKPKPQESSPNGKLNMKQQLAASSCKARQALSCSVPKMKGKRLDGLPIAEPQELPDVLKGNYFLERDHVHRLLLPNHRMHCPGNPAWEAMRSYGVRVITTLLCHIHHGP